MRKGIAVWIFVASQICIAATSAALFESALHRLRTSDLNERLAQVRNEKSSILLILTLYAADNDDRLPAFRSDRLPKWWAEYGKGFVANSRNTYYLDKSFEGELAVHVGNSSNPIRTGAPTATW